MQQTNRRKNPKNQPFSRNPWHKIFVDLSIL